MGHLPREKIPPRASDQDHSSDPGVERRSSARHSAQDARPPHAGSASPAHVLKDMLPRLCSASLPAAGEPEATCPLGHPRARRAPSEPPQPPAALPHGLDEPANTCPIGHLVRARATSRPAGSDMSHRTCLTWRSTFKAALVVAARPDDRRAKARLSPGTPRPGARGQPSGRLRHVPSDMPTRRAQPPWPPAALPDDRRARARLSTERSILRAANRPAGSDMSHRTYPRDEARGASLAARGAPRWPASPSAPVHGALPPREQPTVRPAPTCPIGHTQPRAPVALLQGGASRIEPVLRTPSRVAGRPADVDMSQGTYRAR
jgi:hypothetical protein